MILCFSGQLGKFCDVVIDVASFHLQFVEFHRCFVVGIGVVPILDKVLFELLPDIDVRWSWDRSSHDPVFCAAFPFRDGGSLYERERVCDLSIRVGHDWCGGVEELVELEFVHELVHLRSITGENGGFFPFQFSISLVGGCWLGGCGLSWSSSPAPSASSAYSTASSTSSTSSASRPRGRTRRRGAGARG